MSELRYAYDLYPRDDPRDGARILRFSDLGEDGAEWVHEANGTGSGVIVLPGDSPDAASIDPRGLQYVRVVEIDPDDPDGATLSGFAERVVHGFFLDTGSFDALTEQNTKRLTFGGAGTLSYWARAVMAPHTYIHDVFTGQDPFDRTWRLDQQSTVFANGNYTGAMLWRVLYELSHFRSGATYTHKHADGIIYTDAHDDDRTESAVPDAVIDFTAFLDSNGNAWTEKVGEFRVSVLDNGLSVIRLLMELGAYVEMDPHTFETRAYQASSHRRDRTGAAWGASVIRFQSPTDGTLATGNILSDYKRALTAHIQRSTMWAGGGDDVYAKATGTFDIPWEGGLNSDANDLDALEVQADRQITARSDAGDTLRVRTVPIDDPASGFYRPLHSTGTLLDDLATVHNGAGQWDSDEQTFPVAAVGAKLREGGDWDTFVDLGASFRPMEGRQFQVAPLGSHTHPPNPPLCAPAQPGGVDEVLYGPLEFAGGTQETVAIYPSGTGQWPIDSSQAWIEAGWNAASGCVGAGGAFGGDANSPKLPATPGVTYRWSCWANTTDVQDVAKVAFYDVADAQLSIHTLAGSVPAGGWSGPYVDEYVAPSGAAYMRLLYAVAPTTFDSYDNVLVEAIGEAGSNPLHGTSKYAARCDSTEHEILARDPTVNDDEDAGYPRRTIWHNSSSGATFISTDGTEGAAVWVEIGGGAAPTDATYLVTAAHADLSAEVVVGATPGGELGGTWPAPTVDATHSGSTHAATQAAAEATAAGALSTHAGAADPHSGYQKESEKGAASGYASLDGSTKVPIAQVPTGSTSTTVPLGDHTHASGGGELLMQDGVSSPPVPLENEAGTDWLYAG